MGGGLTGVLRMSSKHPLWRSHMAHGVTIMGCCLHTHQVQGVLPGGVPHTAMAIHHRPCM
jgi:hypothetical protein